MISLTDLLHLPYTPDLTEGGIAYALRSLPYSFSRADARPYDQIRRTVAGAAVELAFRRYLSQQEIPFEIAGANPFTNPDQYDVSLGGRRCDIQSFFISHRGQITKMRDDPSVILDAPALVPSDHHVNDSRLDRDLYLFAFLSGLIAASQSDLQKAVETDQPHYLIHVMPEEWRRPFRWNPLGPLVLKSESDTNLPIEISGQDEGRNDASLFVNLPPQKRVTLDDSFYSVTAIHAKRIPNARLGMHSPALKETRVIAPLEWGNIWLYGMGITLAGWITREEFRRRAASILPNSRVFQYDRTKTKNLAVPVSSLNPLGDLFARVREWEAKRKRGKS